MRFGRTLSLAVYPPWKDNYVDYAKLKKLLREDESPTDSSAEQWTEEDESAFVNELINVQLEKVHDFHRDTYQKLRDRAAKCEAKLDDIAVAEHQDQEGEDKDQEADGKSARSGNGKKAVPSESERNAIAVKALSELEEITKETNELGNYSRINYTGFLKAAKKHDRKRGSSYRVRPILQVRLAALPFNKEDYGPLLFRLNAMREFALEHTGKADDKLAASQINEASEEYISHKYWVHPDNILEVKAMVQRHLPTLVYNPQTQKVAEGNQPDPSITSIYFDNPSFSLYSNKVDNNLGSSLRLRWYGQLDDKPEIWFEKKTVKEQDTSSESRFSIKDKYIQRFLNNEYHLEKQISKLEGRTGPDSSVVENLRTASEEIQKFVQENQLQPILRANYNRTAFQIPGDDRVRVSLDTDLAFIREDAVDSDRPCRDPETWHRTDIDNNKMSYPFSSIRKGEINRFPFALLEFKVRTGSNRKVPEWINDITSTHLVKDAPRFSKFVHGVAELFEDYVNTFPFWLSQIETDIRRDPQQAFEEEQAKKQREADDEVAVGSFLRSKASQSPRTRGTRGSISDALISPVGSPSVADTTKKGLTARASRLGSSQIDNIVEEPDEDETGIRADRSDAPTGFKSMFSTFSTSKYARARRAGRVKLPPGVEEPKYWIKDQGPLKIEGKVWLANQRTFIKWQHVSVLLASLSLGLYNAAGEDNNIARALGLVYTLVAVFTAAWGYGVYMWRTDLIKRRSGKDFDAVIGPLVVCVSLGFALALNFGFKVCYVERSG